MSTQAPLRVLLLTTSFPLSKESQSGVFIRKMIENLPIEIQVTVLTPDSPSVDIFESGAYSLVRFRYALKKWQQLAHGSGGIMATLNRNKFFILLLPPFLFSCFIMTCQYARKADVLHANWSINGVLAGIAGWLFDKPVITTLRGSDVNLMEKSRLMRQLVRICLFRSERIVTVSPSLKKILTEEFPRYLDKVNVISNGVEQAFFNAGENTEVKNTNGEQAEPVRFLYAGNLTAGKGVHLILEAATSLSTDNWYLDIVGDGPERKKLEAYCRDNFLESSVFFHGSVAPEDMPMCMGRADAFVFASFAEGRPNAVLEAMAARLPVIAAAIPAVLDLIKNGRQGFLFPPGDTEKMREHMAFLLSHPAERRMMGDCARNTIKSMGLSWKESAGQYAALYAEVTSDRRMKKKIL